MWHLHPQHVIDVTESGKPIHFHYSEGDAENKYTPVDHHEAATAHDRRRNRDAQMASHLEKIGLKASANGYRKRAQHHGAQATLHMDKVLPQAQKEPKIQQPKKPEPSPSKPNPPAYVTAQSVYQKKKK